MSFEEFWAAEVGRGPAGTPQMRQLAMNVWDAALCSAQALKWDANRRTMDAREWAGLIGGLHTWVRPGPAEGGEA